MEDTDFFWHLVFAWLVAGIIMTIPIVLATVYVLGRSRIADWCYVVALLIVIATHVVVLVALGPGGWIGIFLPVWTLRLWHGAWPVFALVPVASSLFVGFAPLIKGH